MPYTTYDRRQDRDRNPSNSIRYATDWNPSMSPTAGIQEAIDDVPAQGGDVYMPPGLYTISTPIVPKSHVRLRGAGVTATILKLADGANCNMFLPSVALQYATFEGFQMNGNKANQTQNAGSRDARSGFMIGDAVTGNALLTFRNLLVTSFRHGAGLRLANVTDLALENVYCTSNGQGGDANGGDGTWLGSCSRVNISDYWGINSTDTGLAMDGTSHAMITNAHAQGNFSQGFALGQGSAYINYLNCDATSNTGHGFCFQKFGGAFTQNTYLANCISYNNGAYGIQLQDHVGLKWVGGTLQANTSGEINLVSGNLLIQFDNPVGYVTENNGTQAFAAVDTVKTVSHGLSRTPALKDFRLNFAADPLASTKLWVSNITSTQFNINTTAPGGAGTSVAWSVRIPALA